METGFQSQKLDFCKVEIKALLQKLLKGNYHTTAEVVFDHIAHTGVETDLDTSLKSSPTFYEFIDSKLSNVSN